MTTTAARAAGVVEFIRRRPLTAFFLWLFTVGQAFAFAPVVVLWTTGIELPAPSGSIWSRTPASRSCGT